MGRNNSIDRIDNMDTLVEEKNAKGLKRRFGPRQTEQEWSDKQIYEKMKARLSLLATATSTFPVPGQYIGPATLPTMDQLRSIRKVRFEIQGDWQELRTAVAADLGRLRAEFPAMTIDATFGVTPGKAP